MPSIFLQLSFLLLTWFRASWSAGTPRLKHVCTDRPLYTSGEPRNSLSWRLTRLWTDVRIFLHLCILGTCRWDLIKDLSTWLAVPLQHDWNVHNSFCELPRVSVLSGSSALVFALHDLTDFNHLVDELNLQGFNRLLHLLNHGNLCCVTTDISRIWPLCCPCVRHLPLLFSRKFGQPCR